jgi:hypothetical protein
VVRLLLTLVVGLAMQEQAAALQLLLAVALAVEVILDKPELLTGVVVVALTQEQMQAAQASSSSRPTNNEGLMETKIYRLYGIDTAMHLLRPGAKWEITNSHFSNWEDPRPCPKWEEVLDTMEKIKAFEDSINTVWLPEQIAELTGSPEAQAKAQVAQMIEEQKAA